MQDDPWPAPQRKHFRAGTEAVRQIVAKPTFGIDLGLETRGSPRVLHDVVDGGDLVHRVS